MTTLNKFFSLACALLATAIALPAFAQENATPVAAPGGFEAGPYQFNLGLEAGYRSTNIVDPSGSTGLDAWALKRYDEAFHLDKGINLNSFNLYGEKKGEGGLFDVLSLTASGLNEPFTDGSLQIRSYGKYDLKVDFKRALYYMDRNDSLYSGLHKFDFTRQFINASLNVEATDFLNVNLQVNNTSRNGTMTQTYSPHFEGGELVDKTDAFSGGYARDEFYWISVPKVDKTTEFLGSLNFKSQYVNVSAGGGIRNYSDDFLPTTVDNQSLTHQDTLANGQLSPNANLNGLIGRMKHNELLNTFNYEENRTGKGTMIFGELTSRPIPEISLTANLQYEATKFDVVINENQGGNVRTGARDKAGTYNKYYNYSAGIASNGATSDVNSLVASVSATGHILDNLSVTGRFRMTTMDETTDAEYTTFANLYATIADSTKHGEMATKITYKTPTNLLEGFVNYSPSTSLNLRAGIQILNRTPDVARYDGETAAELGTKATIDSAFSVNLSKKTASTTPYFSFSFRPASNFKVNGSISQTKYTVNYNTAAAYNSVIGTVNTNDAQAEIPIRMTPQSLTKYKLGFETDPIENLTATFGYAYSSGYTDFTDMTGVKVNGGSGVLGMINAINPEYTNKTSTVTGGLNYQINPSTGVSVAVENSTNDMVMPMTWTRGSILIYPPLGDLKTVLIEEHFTDQFIDFSFNTDIVKGFHFAAGLTMLRDEGTNFVSQDAINGVNATNDTINKQALAGITPDVTRNGAPYTSYTLHGMLSYDITPMVGVTFDWQHVFLKEDDILQYYALNNFDGNLIRGSLYLKL